MGTPVRHASPVGLAEARRRRSELASFARSLDPQPVPLAESGALWSELDQMERLIVGAKTLLASRVDDSKEWKRKGFRSAAEHLAALAGTTVGEGRPHVARQPRSPLQTSP